MAVQLHVNDLKEELDNAQQDLSTLREENLALQEELQGTARIEILDASREENLSLTIEVLGSKTVAGRLNSRKNHTAFTWSVSAIRRHDHLFLLTSSISMRLHRHDCLLFFFSLVCFVTNSILARAEAKMKISDSMEQRDIALSNKQVAVEEKDACVKNRNGDKERVTRGASLHVSSEWSWIALHPKVFHSLTSCCSI